MQAIYFDMDGTLADLYHVPNWLELLKHEQVTPYIFAAPMYNMHELNALLERFIAQGVIIGVISWAAQDASKEYKLAIKRAKHTWIKHFLPCVSEFHVVQYGTPKHKVAKVKDSILVDDNASVRMEWNNGVTIDATHNIIAELQKLY